MAVIFFDILNNFDAIFMQLEMQIVETTFLFDLDYYLSFWTAQMSKTSGMSAFNAPKCGLEAATALFCGTFICRYNKYFPIEFVCFVKFNEFILLKSKKSLKYSIMNWTYKTYRTWTIHNWHSLARINCALWMS